MCNDVYDRLAKMFGCVGAIPVPLQNVATWLHLRVSVTRLRRPGEDCRTPTSPSGTSSSPTSSCGKLRWGPAAATSGRRARMKMPLLASQDRPRPAAPLRRHPRQPLCPHRRTRTRRLDRRSRRTQGQPGRSQQQTRPGRHVRSPPGRSRQPRHPRLPRHRGRDPDRPRRPPVTTDDLTTALRACAADLRIIATGPPPTY
jgi:hypothetical protein